MTLRYLKTVRKPNGRVHRYLQAPGCKLVKLPDLPPDHPDFLEAYTAAMRSVTPIAPGPRYATGTIGAAIDAYMASDHFLTLAGSTRATRARALHRLASKAGKALLRDLRPDHIDADLAGLPAHPANNRLKVWRGLLGWAKSARLVRENISLQVAPRRTPKTAGHAPWTPEDVAAFRAHWPVGTMQRLAFEILHWTGARISDAVRFGPGMIDRQGWLTYSQQKTGGEVAVPWSRALPGFAAPMQTDLDHLHRALDARTDRHMTFLTTEAGSARSIKAFGQWFSGAARTAGIVGKTAHGLRKRRATALAELGATDRQIMAWTGHEDAKEVTVYTRKADKRRLLSDQSENAEGNAVEPLVETAGKSA